MKNREMTAGHWRAIEAVFDAALELPAPDRAVLLAAQAPSLRCEVEALLAAREQAEDFLCQPAAQLSAVLSEHVNGAVNEQIGPYRLLRQLGGGGMGVVWLAERADGQFKQQVALKLIHAGSAFEAIHQRFLHERQILADLQHPHIARLTDGGVTADGRPFFVMEYIAGAPLDAYCRERQLSLNERLRLFLQVCAAVQYAHQHLVIHRDLKHGNILVTEDGTPKLLDFGIAKLVQPAATQSFETLPGAQPMTPAYASPEQVRGEKLTTTTDVYSLGVVLYELLAGRSPYRLQTDTFGELTRVICEQEPLKPSATAERVKGEGGGLNADGNTLYPVPLIFQPSVLRGDLDSIVLMALRKEAQARYPSVEQFAEDIRRYLNGLPTIARRGSFGYRALKYMRRNRVPLAAAALIMLSLLGGIGATWRQARIALAAQARAEDERLKADTQRQRAEAALTNAEERRQQAEAARNEANEQRAEAETQREQANEQRAFADAQRTRAETQELANRRLLYTSRMGLAQQAWEEANIGRMQDLLRPYLPQAGAPDFRGFEWYHLWRQSHQEERTLPFPVRGTYSVAVFSADGKQLLMAGMNRATTPETSATEVLIYDTTTGQLLQTMKLPPASLWVFARDRQTLALMQQGGNEVLVVSLSDGALLHRVNGLRGGLSCLDFTPDGRQIVSGFRDGSLALLDLATTREVYHFKPHQGRAFTVAVSPDGRQFVSGGDRDRSARLWDVASGREIRTLSKSLEPTQSSIFSPDGRLVAVSGTELTTVWEVASGKELVRLENKGRQMIFTPDSRNLFIGGEDGERQSEIAIFDTTTWREIGVLRGHGNWVMSLAISPNGQWLVSGGLDRLAKLWRLNKPGNAPSFTDPRTAGLFTQVAMTPDGKRLLIGKLEQLALVCDIATGKEVMTLAGHTPLPSSPNNRFSVAVSTDGKWFATGGMDGQVRLWEAATGKEFKHFQVVPPIRALSFAPRGQQLVVSDLNQVRIWDVPREQWVGTLSGQRTPINRLSFAPDGAILYGVGLSSVLTVWEVATGQLHREYRCGDSGITSFALSGDGKWFATGGTDTTARVWDAQTGQEIRRFKGHVAPVSAVAFSPDGRRLATGGQDKIVRLWDLATGEELVALKGHRTWITDNAIGFSPDGTLLYSADWHKQVKFWRAARAQELPVSVP